MFPRYHLTSGRDHCLLTVYPLPPRSCLHPLRPDHLSHSAYRPDHPIYVIGKGELPVSFKLLDASTQVVAGMNFKMRIQLDELGEGGRCLEVFDVQVYNRFGDLSVTKFGEEALGCFHP